MLAETTGPPELWRKDAASMASSSSCMRKTRGSGRGQREMERGAGEGVGVLEWFCTLPWMAAASRRVACCSGGRCVSGSCGNGSGGEGLRLGFALALARRARPARPSPPTSLSLPHLTSFQRETRRAADVVRSAVAAGPVAGLRATTGARRPSRSRRRMNVDRSSAAVRQAAVVEQREKCREWCCCCRRRRCWC